MVNLWERLNHIYGHRFSSAYGESAVDTEGNLTATAQTWAVGLANMTGQQIADGLHKCIESDEWPSLPMFRINCLPSIKNGLGLDYVPEYYRKQPLAIEHKTIATKQTAADRLAEIKKMIRG